MSYGGQEAFILNMYSHFNIDADFCFITPFHANNESLLKKIHENGDKCIADNRKFNSPFRKLSIILTAMSRIERNANVIHVHSGSIFNLLAVAFIAKKKKVKRVIVHSHATGNINRKHDIIKRISDKYLSNYADEFLACSREAAYFKFSDQIIDSECFHIIKNGINIDRFVFDQGKRIAKRKELEIDEFFVICNVGRFSPEKNHLFLIEVLKEYLRIDKNAILLLAGGKGETESLIRERIKEYGLNNSVKILKERSDINEILFASDVFVFPSTFEGLGMSAIEAQAAGLKTFCSEFVPAETKVSDLYIQLSLEDGPKAWATRIFEERKYSRENKAEELERAGYSAEACARQLEEIYM